MSWILVLTTCKAVNPGLVRAVCANLVKVQGELVTNRACIKGHELTIRPATITTTLGITVEADYDYPLRPDHLVVSFYTIVSEISRRRRWS